MRKCEIERGVVSGFASDWFVLGWLAMLLSCMFFPFTWWQTDAQIDGQADRLFVPRFRGIRVEMSCDEVKRRVVR